MSPSQVDSSARINSSIRDLFIYLYDLSPLDLDLLFLMIKSKEPMTLEQLAKKMDKDKSTAFRSLQKLVLKGLCIKETKTIKEGGYFHMYKAVDITTFKEETEKRVKELQTSFDRLLRKFEEDLHGAISSFYEK